MAYEVRSEEMMLHPCGDPPSMEQRFFLVREGSGIKLPFLFRTGAQAAAFAACPESVNNQLLALKQLELLRANSQLLKEQLANQERMIGYLQNILQFPFTYADFSQDGEVGGE